MAVVEVAGTTYHIDNKLKKKWDEIKDGQLAKEDNDRVFDVDGRERCLAGDTLIQVSRFKLSRKYHLETLYNHYHGILNRGKLFDLSEPSRVRSFNGKEIKLHKINDIVFSGVKKVYLLTLENSLSIKATAEHKIMTSKGFVELRKLKNHLIMCDTLNPEKQNRKRIKFYDIALKVGKNHPFSSDKGRVAVHILIYESRINKLSFTDYIDLLLNEPEKSKKLKFINTSIYVIHHKDGCHYNNSIENLVKLKNEEHKLEHNNYSNFSQGSPKFSKVKCIEYIGKEKTYDIVCDEPHHNFVANGIVVHNSGKSLWTLQQAAYIDPTFIKRFMSGKPTITFTPEDTLKAIQRTKSSDTITKCVVFDEAFRGLSSRSVLSKTNKLIVQALMEMGQKNLVLFIVLPSFFLLDRYPAVLRSNALIHIERPKKHLKAKGRNFKVFNYQKKAWLYNMGLTRGWGYPMSTRFKGRFYGKYPGGEEVEKYYRKMKHDSLIKIEKELGSKSEIGKREAKYIAQRNLLINFLFETLKISQAKLTKILNEKGMKITPTNISMIIKDPLVEAQGQTGP